MCPMSVFVLKISAAVANIPFQNGILPVDPSGHGTVNMRAGQLIWSVVSWKQKFQGTATITVIVR